MLGLEAGSIKVKMQLDAGVSERISPWLAAQELQRQVVDDRLPP